MKIIRPMSPLRRRMLEDMQIRNDSPHTIDGYLRYVAQFAKHFGTSPDRLGPAHIRTYQLHLLHTHASESIFIQTVCALRFLYETTLGRSWMVDFIPYPKRSYWIPGSWNLRMSYTDAIPCPTPYQESNGAGQYHESDR